MKIAISELEHLREEVKNCHQIIRNLQKKREWVKLTDEDLEFWTKELGQEEFGRGVLRAVADHLKEKNT